MAADRKISTITDNRIRNVGSRDKIVVFKASRMAISYWGLATLSGRQMREHLITVRSQILEAKQTLDVDTFSNRLRDYLQQYIPGRNMGFHVAGYVDGQPRIRHVFHADWHPSNGFTSEESNRAFHDGQGRRIPHTQNGDYVPYISLFNGDNAIVQSLLLSIPAFRGLNYVLDYEALSLEKAIRLAQLLISTTIYFQKFLRGCTQIGRTCGNGLDVVRITPSKIEWVCRNLKTVNFDVR